MTDDPDTIGPDGSVRLRGAAAQVLRDEREAALEELGARCGSGC